MPPFICPMPGRTRFGGFRWAAAARDGSEWFDSHRQESALVQRPNHKTAACHRRHSAFRDKCHPQRDERVCRRDILSADQHERGKTLEPVADRFDECFGGERELFHHRHQRSELQHAESFFTFFGCNREALPVLQFRNNLLCAPVFAFHPREMTDQIHGHEVIAMMTSSNELYSRRRSRRRSSPNSARTPASTPARRRTWTRTR